MEHPAVPSAQCRIKATGDEGRAAEEAADRNSLASPEVEGLSGVVRKGNFKLHHCVRGFLQLGRSVVEYRPSEIGL